MGNGVIDTNGLTLGNGVRPPALRLVGGGGWPLPQPIVSTLPPVARFTADLLPDALRRYVFDVADILRALGWADYLRSHANRLYAAGQTMSEEGARLVVERRGLLPDPFTARDLHKKDWTGLTDKDAVLSAIEVLLGTYHCREVIRRHAGAGRPTIAYEWNPNLRVEG